MSSWHLVVHATPGARRNRIGGSHDGALRVSVNAPADRGRANKAIRDQVAQALGLPAGQVELIRGQTSRRKVFVLHDPPREIEQRVNQLMSESN